MKKLEDQIDKLDLDVGTLLTIVSRQDETLVSIDKRLAEYNKELEFHVARTTQLEEQLEPIIKQHEQFKGALKLIGLLATIAGIYLLFN